MIFKTKTNQYFIFILLLILIMYIPLFAFKFKTVFALTEEDHFYENFQAITFLLTSFLMLFLYIKSKSTGEKYVFNFNRNIYFLLLALFFFICFGEEISWGQRIFGIETPMAMSAVNSQDETNIHNLWFFESYDKREVVKTGLSLWVSSARLFALIWLIYCFLIPLSDHLFSFFRRIYQKLHFPVVPLWLGSLFVIAHLLSKLAERLWMYSQEQPVIEIKEATFSFLYLIVGIVFVTMYFNNRELKKDRA